MGGPHTRRSTVKKQLSRLHRAVLLGLCFPWASYLVFFFPSPDLPEDPLQHPCTTFFKKNSNPEAWVGGRGGGGITYYGVVPPPFDPPDAFLSMCSVFLALRMGNK